MTTTMLDLQLEEISRAILLAVKENIEDAIDDVWAEMAVADAEFYAQLGEALPSTPKLYPVRYFIGHHPSMLYRPSADYPNIAAVAYRHRSANDDGDQYEIAVNTGYLEAFVVHPDESTVNRLTHRYAKALHRVVASLKGVGDEEVEDISLTPNVELSNAAARREDEFKEDITYIQGCRLELNLRTMGTW